MKKIIFFALFILIFTGCVTVQIPRYLRDEFPYKKTYYAKFKDTRDATLQALKDLKWKVSDVAHPAGYDQAMGTDGSSNAVLIFTEIRQTPLFLSSKYMSLNIYVQSAKNGTDVEIRYVSVMPVLFKSVQSYKNDAVVYKIFNRVSEILEE